MEGLVLSKMVVPAATFSGKSVVPQKIHLRSGADFFPAFRSKSYDVKLQRSSVLKVQAKKQTFTSFDDMITNSDLPVFVDFYATWCGPCQFMAPILSEVGKAMQEKIRIVKVDTEKYPAVASRYGIRSLPTFVLFVDGKPIDWLEGALQKDDLIAHIEGVLQAEVTRGARVD